VKLHDYDRLIALQTNRRNLLKGAAGMGALTAMAGLGLGLSTRPALADAESDLRAQILQIPGVGKGSPTDADWQKVGALCLGATKANVKEG
jgi:multiple sugar transport system substrate-binding protein